MSLAAHAVGTAALLYCVIVALVIELAVCFVMNTDVLCVVTSSQCTAHPFAAVGNPTTPLEAVPPLPTLIVKTAVPLLWTTAAFVPNPDAIVGDSAEMIRCATLML